MIATRLLLLLLASLPGMAAAFDRSDGVQVQCEVERHGERRIAREVWIGRDTTGDRLPDLGGAAALVLADKDGWPVIYFDRAIMRSMQITDPHLIDFIFYHECAHATSPHLDEFAANCEAFLELERQGLMTELKERALGFTHRKSRYLPARYGGSGAVFWEKTMNCVEARRAQARLRDDSPRH